MNFYAKSGVCSSKNERVIALGTKKDGHSTTTTTSSSSLYSSDYTVQTLFVRSSQVWTIFILHAI